MKRFLSVLLIICMLCPLFSVMDIVMPAEAADTSDYVWSIVNDDDSRISYTGKWTLFSNATAHLGKYCAISTEIGASATLKFTGTGIRYYTMLNGASYSSDSVKVYLDDKEVANVSMDGASYQSKLAYEATGLENKEHTIKIVNNAAGEGRLDYFEVGNNDPYVRVDETAVTYTNFSGTVKDNSQWFNKTLSYYKFAYNTTPIEFFKYDFVGTGIRLGTRMIADGCKYIITIDDNAPITINTYEKTLMEKQNTFCVSDLEYGKHTIKVELLAPSSGDWFAWIDYIDILDSSEWIDVDDDDPHIKYTGSGWVNFNEKLPFGGSVKESYNTGDSASLTFTGTGVRYHAMVNSSRYTTDKVEVYLDDQLVKTVSLQADSFSRLLAYEVTNLEYKEHTITVKSCAPTSGGTEVNIDYFQVKGSVEDSSSGGSTEDTSDYIWSIVDADDKGRLTYSGGGWNLLTNETNPMGGTVQYTSKVNDTVSLTFKGEGVRFYAMNHISKYAGDKVKVYIDGVFQKFIDLTSDGFKRSCEYEITGLTNETHTITIKNTMSTVEGNALYVDYFEVANTDAYVRVDDTDESIVYANKTTTHKNNTNWFGKTLTQFNIPAVDKVNEFFSYTFNGSGIRIGARTNADCAIYKISIDGATPVTVNTYMNGGLKEGQNIFCITGLPNMEHTVEVSVMANKSTRRNIWLDYIDVFTGGEECIGFESAVIVDANNWVIDLNFTEPVNISNTGLIYLCNTINPSDANNWASGDWQCYVKSLEYINGEKIDGKEYSRTVRASFTMPEMADAPLFVPDSACVRICEYNIGTLNDGHIPESVVSVKDGKLLGATRTVPGSDIAFAEVDFSNITPELLSVENIDGNVKAVFDQRIKINDLSKVSLEINGNTYAATSAIYSNGKADYAEYFPKQSLSVPESLKILAIGNSFTQDPTYYLYDVLDSAGVKDITVGNLYIGGCTVDMHVSNIKNNAAAYTYYYNTAGTWQEEANKTLDYGLLKEDWDIIVLHQASGSHNLSSNFNNLQYLIDHVNDNKTNSNAKLWWQMSWAYDKSSGHAEFYKYNYDQEYMYRTLLSRVKNEVASTNSFAGIIPSATTMQNMRSYIGDNVTRDGYHANYFPGRYALAMTWACALTGCSPYDIEWAPSGADAELVTIAKTSVANAIGSPYDTIDGGYGSEVVFSFDYDGDISNGKLVISDNGEENGLIESIVAESYHGRLLAANTDGDKIVKAINPSNDDTIDVGKDLSDEIVDGKVYSLMNADTGRYFGNGNTSYFTFKAEEGTNRYSIYDETTDKYLKPDGSLSKTPYIYIITEALGGRYKIKSTNGINTLKDNDSGSANVAVCEWGRVDNYIENLWFLTLKGEEEPLKIMPLGDSITYGINQDIASTEQTGNTPFLSNMLLEAEETNGRIITVGSVKPKVGYETDDCLYRNEGHPGWLAHNEYAYVANLGQAGLDEYIDGWMAKYAPDVICMQIGTNDCGYLHSDLPEVKSYEETFKGWENLVDQILNNMGEDDLLIAATPTHHGNNIVLDGTYKEWGLSEKEYVAKLNEQGEDRVVIADNFNYVLRYAGRTTGTCTDFLHLSQLGYEKMGESYYKSIMKELYGVDLFEKIEPLTLNSAKLLNESSILLTFSDDIVVDGSPFVAMRLVDNNDTLVWDGATDNSTPMQFYGSMYPYNNSKNQYVWIMSGSDQNTYKVNNIYELLEYIGIEEFKQYDIKFCIEETTSGNAVAFPFDDRIENIYRENSDGTKEYLSATRSVNQSLDDVYISVSGEYVIEHPEVVSAIAINASQIKVKFSEPIEFISNPFMALRFIDENGNLAWDGVEGQGGKPLQWEVKWEYADSKKDTLIFTLDAVYYGVGNLTQLMNYSGELSQFKDKGYTLVLGIEDLPNENNPVQFGNGRIEAIASIATGNRLSANRAEYFDKLYFEFTTDYDPATITLKSATAINASQIVLEFSDKVNISGTPYMAVRMVDENGKLVWDGEKDESTPMQWSGKYEYYKGDKSKILFTMNEPTYEVLNITELFSYKNLEDFKDYEFKFCIEETQPGIIPSNCLVENIANAKGQYLEGNLLNPASLDGVYVDIDIDYNMDQLDIASAEVINQSQILVSFTDSVEIDGGYIAVRLIDGEKNLMWTGAKDKSIPLQFDGTWEYANDAQTQILWTMKGDNNRATKNLVDVLTYGGMLGDYSWCDIAFCIEEGGENLFLANGQVDIVTNYAGKVLKGNKYTPGGADRIYEYLSVGIDLEKTVELVEAVAINETQIVATFSEPISIGNKGKEPSMSIRYTDHFGYMVWSGEKNSTTAMEWDGSWEYYNDDHTQIIWTIDDDTMGATNITEIINFAGKLKRFEGSGIEFCIEELPENDKNNQGNNRLVCNIRDAETGIYELAATLKGNRDGAYIAFTVDYDATYVEEAPETEAQTPDTETETVPYSYLWVYITGGAIVLIGAVLAIVLKKKNK